MSDDYAVREHQKWIGFLQPTGLVVSARALVDKQVIVDLGTARDVQDRMLDALERQPPRTATEEGDGDGAPAIIDFPAFARDFLGWPLEWLYGCAGSPAIPPELVRAPPDLGEVLAPTHALRDPQPAEGQSPWLLLVQVLPFGTDLDEEARGPEVNWTATVTRKFVRLLHETGVPAGILINGREVRLVSAPHSETAGWMSFPVKAMAEVDGRPILCGFDGLLSKSRLLVGPRDARLHAILDMSRRYQSAVSTQLAAQVLEALYEFLRGFQEADDRVHGELLRSVLASDPDHIYAGLLNTLMRLVFLLYAEDRDLMPADPVYRDHYSLHGLWLRLRKDADQNPDTMDQRFGAWAHLVTLFRAVHTGCQHPRMRMPARRGHLFHPDRYPFLEGRTTSACQLPVVSDGVVQRVLDKLLLLDGERLSYRTLDVEQIGSVYETMMGFRLELATGPTVAIRAKKTNGAPTSINLEQLLAEDPSRRVTWLKKKTDQTISGKAAAPALKQAMTIDDLVAALGGKIATAATPRPVRKGGMVLQPSDVRRKSGSHYTPRSLTAPIVRKALAPHLDRLGFDATPEQLLDLKVCDPAMGSGAFLVEVCRQLADRLIDAWRRHGIVPKLPPDEDERLHARRLVAQRCLYGVDLNAMAVDLAKLSLWLVTLARDHAFTFLDHALGHGDALVGLDERGLRAFHWDPKAEVDLLSQLVAKKVTEAQSFRDALRSAGDDADDAQLRDLHQRSDATLADLRLIGDQAIAAFFSGSKASDRETARHDRLEEARRFLESDEGRSVLADRTAAIRRGERPVVPFHWPLEFPEVFFRTNPGFDAIVGNPPFAGKNTLAASTHAEYSEWLKTIHEKSHGNADLVSHFFRRAFTRLREGGCFGLIATKTIAQGDTRGTGLRWICTHGGEIYAARRRYKWVGGAAVVVSVVHVFKGCWLGVRELDGEACDRITAFLVSSGGHEDPERLAANVGKSFVGSYVLGMGFTFDDTDKKKVASPIAEMHRLLAKDPRNAERIFPYIGGNEVNTDPRHAHHRYVINFGERDETECRGRWPDLMAIIEKRVKPERMANNREVRRRNWWRFGETTPALFAAIHGLDRVLVVARVGEQGAFTFLPPGLVFSEQLIVFALTSHAAYAALQCRPHEVWARFFASTLEDRLRYTPSDCFETFPLPTGFEADATLECAGKAYYDFRADLMVRLNEGVTKVYNRFHDPTNDKPDIVRLRELHGGMDRAVLYAYGWDDIPTACEFIPEDDGLDEDAQEQNGRRRKKKKKYRYRWPDDVQAKILEKLLKLNARRAEEERALGVVPAPPATAEQDESEDEETDVEAGDEEDSAASSSVAEKGLFDG